MNDPEVEKWSKDAVVFLVKGIHEAYKKQRVMIDKLKIDVDTLETKIDSYLNQTASDARVDDCFAYLVKLEERLDEFEVRQLKNNANIFSLIKRLEAMEK